MGKYSRRDILLLIGISMITMSVISFEMLLTRLLSTVFKKNSHISNRIYFTDLIGSALGRLALFQLPLIVMKVA